MMHGTTSLKFIGRMLTSVWQELEYRINVCRVTRGAHIEHLQLSKKNFSSFPISKVK